MIEQLTIIFKLSIAGLCGTLIGKERKMRDKSAGSRTLGIVCVCSCLIAILSLQLNLKYTYDFTRLMAYMIAGIGFIGNGIIVQKRNSVDGLTTAASLLMSTVLGFCAGLGCYFLFFVSFGFIFCILESKYWLNKKKGK